MEEIKLLAFDIFGTVVDWHGSIKCEIEALNLNVDADKFALAWRSGYAPAMKRVMSGELGWTKIDDLHRIILDEVLIEFDITELDEKQKIDLNLAWHRLNPWPDVVEGLTTLKSNYIISTLSNGNISLLTNMAKHAGLPWDCILSAEVFKAYKPHPDTYLGVARTFDLKPEEVMLVAAHHSDLEAARDCGLQTAYIERPIEFGENNIKDVSPRPDNDIHAKNFIDLAEQLSALN